MTVGLYIPEKAKRGRGLLISKKHLNKKENNQNTEKDWNMLKDAIKFIFDRKHTKLFFQALYKAVYDLVCQKKGDYLYKNTTEEITKQVEKIKEELKDIPDEIYLKSLYKLWEEYHMAINKLRGIYLYMDRNYVAQNQKQTLMQLGIQIFAEIIFGGTRKTTESMTRVQELMLDIMERARNGEQVEPEQFKHVKSMVLMMIQIDKVKIFREQFETKFLQESEIYFKTEATKYFNDNQVIVYLKRIEQRLKTEYKRTKAVIQSETAKKVRDIIKVNMIGEYKDALMSKTGSGCRTMLENWKLDDLNIVYKIVGIVKGGLDPLINLVNTFCKEEGKVIVKSEVLNAKPTDLIEQLLDLYEKHQELVTESFYDMTTTKKKIKSAEFSKAISKAWDYIVKCNDRLEEYLSLYIDAKLKKGKQNIMDSEYDNIFNRVIRLLQHCPDKDIFEQYYKSHLAKRLLSQKSQSDEAEQNMIRKLKAEFGFSFTSKLEGMFTDMNRGIELQVEYNNYLKQNCSKQPFDLSVDILTKGFWPAGINININANLPIALKNSCSTWERFYTSKYPSRVIKWQFTLGNADLKANGFERPFEFNLNTLQMLILLLFNAEQKLTGEQIASMANISFDALKRSLYSLCLKSKLHDRILNRSSTSEDNRKKLLPSDTFEPNEKFHSKTLKIKVSPAIVKQTLEQKAKTMSVVQEDRKTLLECAIVRIMKQYKTKNHQQLVMEVIQQVQRRFQPQSSLIKKCIESLIEREYLKRDEEERTLYHYIA